MVHLPRSIAIPPDPTSHPAGCMISLDAHKYYADVQRDAFELRFFLHFGDLSVKAYRFDSRDHRVSALVALLHAGAFQRLFECVRCNDAERYWHDALDRYLGESLRDFLRKKVVVIRLAPH